MPKLPNPPSNMQLRYAQLEELVGNLLEVHSDRKTTLAARFRLFRQRGFPPTATAVAKTRFAYDMDAVLQITLAFWMMNAFVPQEVVPLVIGDNWDELKNAFRRAFALIVSEGTAEAAVADERPILLVFPQNLQGFQLDKDTKATPAASAKIKLTTAREARDRLFGERHYKEFAPVTFIDLHRVASWVRDAVVHARWYGPETFEAYARG